MSTDHDMKHLKLGMIYGFISLMCFLGADMSSVSFETIMILVSWITLMATIYSIQWFDLTTNGYFILTILMFFAARLARYNAMSITKPVTYIAIGVGLGLVAKCIANGKGWPAVFFLSIFAIEICAMEFEDTFKSVDVTDYL